MSEPRPTDATLDDVIVPTESAPEDHRAHGKMPKHLNDDRLEQRTEHEREEVREDEAQS